MEEKQAATEVINFEGQSSLLRALREEQIQQNFIPFLETNERTNLRSTCSLIESYIPKKEYSYFRKKLRLSEGVVEFSPKLKNTIQKLYVEQDISYSFKNLPKEENKLIVDIQMTSGYGTAFAALRSDGKLIAFGDTRHGGDITEFSHFLENVESCLTNCAAFAALTKSGSVVTWGFGYAGAEEGEVHKNVKSLASTSGAFAAVTKDGAVETWGYPRHGGNINRKRGKLSNGVIKIISNYDAFCVLKNDDSVVSWGNPAFGGDYPLVEHLLISDIVDISNYSKYQFCALKNDGSKVIWPIKK